jgi:sporulation protein YabP
VVEQRSGSSKAEQGHTLTMINRHSLKVTGVDSVKSFDEKEIHLETLQGTLVIAGEELGIKNLNLDKAQLEIEGTVNILSYSAGAHARRKKILEKLFK